MKVLVVGPQGEDDFADNVQDALTWMGVASVGAGESRRELRSRRLGHAAEAVADRVAYIDSFWQ